MPSKRSDPVKTCILLSQISYTKLKNSLKKLWMWYKTKYKITKLQPFIYKPFGVTVSNE